MSSIISIQNAEDGVFSGGSSGGGGGKEYKAGDGITIKNNVISAIPYTAGDGIYINDKTIHARYDSKSLTLNNEHELSVIPYKAGDGITINNNSKTISSVPYTAGDCINIQDKSISAIPYTAGDGITINNVNRTISTIPYSAGDGVSINNKNISVQIDNNTIKLDKDNRLYAVSDVETDTIWNYNIYAYCERDFYKDFDDVKYGNNNLVECRLNFDLTQDLLEQMPQVSPDALTTIDEEEHVFDFTLTNTDGSVINFYIAAQNRYGSYFLLVPLLSINENGIISSSLRIGNDNRPSISLSFHSSQDKVYTWTDLLEMYKDKMTITVNPKWKGINDSHVELAPKYASGVVDVESIETNTLKADNVETNTLAIEDVVLYKDEGEVPYQFKEKSFTQFLEKGYNILYLNDLPNPDDSWNYLVRTTGNNNVELEVFKFVLPDEIHDAVSQQRMGSVICSYLGNGIWKMPFLSVSEGLFNVEYQQRTEGAGLAIQYYYTPPLNLFLQGKMKPEYMLVIDAVATDKALKCDMVEAKNTLKYYESPLPYLYKPVGIGETSITFTRADGTETNPFDCWYIDFGYPVDSEEFQELYEHQMFSYKEGMFGNSYYLEKIGNIWFGNNFSFYGYNGVDTSSVESDSSDARVQWRIDIPINDTMRTLIRYLSADSDDSIIESNWLQFIRSHISAMTYKDDRRTVDLGTDFFNSDTSFGTESINGVNHYYMNRENGYAGKNLPKGLICKEITKGSDDYNYYKNRPQGVIEIELNFGNPYDNSKVVRESINAQNPEEEELQDLLDAMYESFDSLGQNIISNNDITVSIRFAVETNMIESIYNQNIAFIQPLHKIIINSIRLDGRAMIAYPETQSLKLFMSKDLIWRVNDNNYSSGNTFSFISSAYNYEVQPAPNACSSLYTEHNLISERIVVGENVETHAFTLNNVGNNVDIMMNQIVAILEEIQRIEKFLKDIAEAVDKLSTMFNMYVMLDAFSAVLEGGFGLIQFAVNGAIKLGSKMGIRGAETGLEIGELGFKTEIKSAETTMNKLTATSLEAERLAGKAGSSLKIGENAAKTEIKSAETTATKFACEEFEAIGIATDTIKPKTTTTGTKAAVKIPKQKTANVAITKGTSEAEMESEVLNIWIDETDGCIFEFADNSNLVFATADDMIAEFSHTGMSCKALGTNEVKCMTNEGALLKMEPSSAIIKSNSKANPSAVSNVSIFDGYLEMKAGSSEGPLLSMSSTGGTVLKSNSKANPESLLQCSIEDTGLVLADEKGSILRTIKNIGKEAEVWYDRVAKFNRYIESAALVAKAFKAASRGEQYSATGIDITYDSSHETPDMMSSLKITAGKIELTALNNQIVVFGNIYKGIVDPNDSSTWTNEYICDGAAFSALMNRLN